MPLYYITISFACQEIFKISFLTFCEILDLKLKTYRPNAVIDPVLVEIDNYPEDLIEYIKNEKPNADCGEYIDEDISWFGEMLEKEVKKNENEKK